MINILVLLIGGNPLPNYVVAKYLLLDGRDDNRQIPVPNRIIFIHSGDTEPFAKKIMKKLSLPENKIILKNLGQNHRIPGEIVGALNKILEEVRNDCGTISSIHLNYTGGTKPMAVHSSIIVTLSKLSERIILSDIDPDNFKIIIKENQYPYSGDLLDKIKLTIQDILDLHDMRTGIMSENFIFPQEIVDIEEFVKEVIPIYLINQKEERKWFDEIVDKIREVKNSYRKDTQLREKINSNDLSSLRKQLRESFPSLNKLFNEDNLIYDGEAKDFTKFFTGMWLEDFVLNSLLKLKKDNKIPSVNEIKKGIKAFFGNREADIDLVIMKGYQMFLISCTTSQEISEVKLKAFEALYRAEQLGGEHAKVIVVSLMDNSKIEKLGCDLSQFEASKKCHLIGIDEIDGEINNNSSLTNKLLSIIKN